MYSVFKDKGILDYSRVGFGGKEWIEVIGDSSRVFQVSDLRTPRCLLPKLNKQNKAYIGVT